MATQLHGPVRPPVVSPVAGRTAGTLAVPLLAVVLKVVVVLAMLRAVADPAWANLEGKAPVARAVVFPLLVLAVPAFWAMTGRATAYPWVADILVTLACLVDVGGNRLDLYDEIGWFDDAVHLVNTATVSAVAVVLTVPRAATVLEIAQAAVAAGLTASLAWELFEFGSFLTRSTEWTTAYSDTIGDLSLGWVGSVLAVVVLSLGRHRRAAG